MEVKFLKIDIELMARYGVDVAVFGRAQAVRIGADAIRPVDVGFLEAAVPDKVAGVRRKGGGNGQGRGNRGGG